MTDKRKRKLNWFYIPAVILMIAFIAYPLGNAIYLSFFKWNGYSVNKEFVGIENYVSMFKDKVFVSSLRNTLIYGFGCTLFQQIIGLALALFLNSKFKGRGMIRTIIYMPAMVSGLVMGYIMYFFFQYKGGVVNDILAAFGASGYDRLGNGTSAIAVIVFINTWQFVGVSMVIYLAGIQGVSQSYLEAATVDGAGKLKQFFYITLPLLRNILFFCSITITVDSWKLFNESYILPGPGASNTSLFQYMYESGFNVFNMGYASAIGVVLIIILGILSAVQFVARRKQGEL